MPRYLTIVISLIAALSAGPVHAQDELIEQWVQGWVGQSSGRNGTAGEAERIIGEPDATCVPFEDRAYEFNAWVTGEPDRGEEWIEVRFTLPVFATAVEVHEALNPGAVVRILVRDFEDQLHVVWAGEDPNDTCPAVLRADFAQLPFPANSVRVELNTTLVPGYNQLDAVKLVGAPVTDFDPFFVQLDDEAGGNPHPIFDLQSVIDLDNDGWPDGIGRGIDAPAEGEDLPEKFVLHNEGDGTFHYRGPVLPVPDHTWINGTPIAADYDNDGDIDIFEANGNASAPAPLKNLLLRNDRGIFVDVTDEAGLTAERVSTSAIWFDYDRDGWTDLYVGNWTWIEGNGDQQNILYRNQGDGTFVDATAEAGLDIQWYSEDAPFRGGTGHGFIPADFDDDGWTDLYVVVGFSPNRLLFNDEGRFRTATSSEIGIVADSFGAMAGDVDNDGDLDFMQTATTIGGSDIGENTLPQRTTLFLNLGNEQFLDVTEGFGLQTLNAVAVGFGFFFDYDNDADVDLFFGEGLLSFFENMGDDTFIERPFESGLAGLEALGDFNGDGFVDVLNGRAFHHNAGNDNHYLSIDLVGTESNRDGIGAVVFATTGDTRQRRDLIAGTGWTQDELLIHFGLGQETSVDQLEIRWPSGQIEFIDNIPADQRIRIIEGRSEWYPAHRTTWETTPPDAVTFGQRLDLDAIVRPALFEPSAAVISVVADLSGLGGPEAVPLEDLGDGTYRLAAGFTVGGEAQIRDVEVFIEQETSLGPYWINLIRHVEVKGDPNTAVLEDFSATLPEGFALDQNFPNPFNSGTVIRFALPTNENVELMLYNLAGQQVATLVKGLRQAGNYAITWDGRDDAGRALATGTYLYSLQAGDRIETRKLTLLR